MDLVDLSHSLCGDGHPRTDGSPIAFASDQPQEHAMVGARRLIQKKRWWLTDVEDDDVEIAVVVDIAKRDATPRFQRSLIQPGRIRYLFKGAIAKIPKKLDGLCKANLAG